MDISESGDLQLTESEQLMVPYWETRREHLAKDQAAGNLDPEIIDEQTGRIKTETEGFNKWLEAQKKKEANFPGIVQSASAQKPFYQTGKQHKNIHLSDNADLLRSDIPYEVGENDPSHPNYEKIYGDTARWSWKQALTNLTGPIGGHIADFGVADDRAELHRNRKHLFTSGSGTADAETNLVELRNTIQGAAYSLVDGVLTLPETTGRIISGQNPFSENFELSWDPLSSLGIKEPWTGTKFGDAGVVIGSFSVGGAGTTGLLGKIGKIKKLGAFSKWIQGLSNTQKIMIGEALYMQASPYRTDQNAFNLLKETPLLRDNPIFQDAIDRIAVGENDHPAVKQLKNTLEAAGLAGLFTKIFAIAGSKLKGGERGIAIRGLEEGLGELSDTDLAKIIGDSELGRYLQEWSDTDISWGTAQLLEEATEFRAPQINKGSRMRAAKNRLVAGIAQGNIITGNSIGKILKQLDDVTELGYGSVDSVLRPRDAELAINSAEFGPEFLKTKAKELLGDPYVQGLLKDAERSGQTFEQIFAPAFRRFHETLGGDIQKLSNEDFWRLIDIDKSPENLMENIVASDLVNQALFKEIRDVSNVTLDMNKVADIFGTDAPMTAIAEKLAFGLTNVKRARYLLSDEYRRLSGKAAAGALAQRTSELHDETIDGVRLMMQFLRDSDSDELAQGILEVFSMADKIKNFRDFDQWMRTKLRGGHFGDKSRHGVMGKELGAMMVNSILSSPKTPLRAILGTTSNAYLNEISTLFGSTIRAPFTGDVAAMRASMASTNAMFQLIPDAFKLFKANVSANFTGDLSNIKTRYTNYSRADINFEILGRWAEKHGTDGDKAAFYIANAARHANSNKLFTWSSRVLGATDDSFRWLLSKARARKKAVEKVMAKYGDDVSINPEKLREIEDIEFSRLHNEDGVLDITKDSFLEKNFKEVTLTTELGGFTEGLNNLMSQYPLTKPFFLFARTGINGLRLSVKNIPIVGAIVNESRAILGATDDMAKQGYLLKYGIESAQDLASAKSLIIGRQAIGSLVVYGVAHKYLAGGITGNGPADAGMKKLWMDSGWQPRSIKIGNAWVSYDSLEPFNLIFANIADVGDNMELMGPQWSEQRLQLIVAALGKGITSKTYLQGLSQLMDLVSGEGGGYKLNRTAANLVNNQLPLASMRNEMAKILNPSMRELSSSFWDHIANRNPLLRGTLPIKYDMLNGKPVNTQNFMQRAFNAVSPIQLTLDKGPGRDFLFNSNYDLRLFSYTSPDGLSLVKHPKIRSLFQNEIGKLNLEATLNKISSRSDILASLAKMRHDLQVGNHSLDPMKAYRHNRVIKALFDNAKKIAWARLRNHPDIIKLQNEKLNVVRNNKYSLNTSNNIINFPK